MDNKISLFHRKELLLEQLNLRIGEILLDKKVRNNKISNLRHLKDCFNGINREKELKNERFKKRASEDNEDTDN
jgi:hypothetical protein